MSSRLRRLQSDHRLIEKTFHEHPFISIVQLEGNPPEKYTIQYSIPGLVPKGDDGFVQSNLHSAEIFLPLEYPRRPPFSRMITPIYHPNIDPQKICIGDHWSAGESLAHLIIRIGEMICFQSHNIKSPLNAEAAAWVEKNVAKLPLSNVDLMKGL